MSLNKSFTTSWIHWFTLLALPLQVFESFNYEVTILSAVGALQGQIFINFRFLLLCWSFFFLLDLFLLFPSLAASEVLFFDFLLSEILFVLLDFLSSDRMNKLLSSVYVWKSL